MDIGNERAIKLQKKREWYAANKERLRIYYAQRYEKKRIENEKTRGSPEFISAQEEKKKRQIEARRETRRKWREKNKDEINAKRRAYSRTDKFKEWLQKTRDKRLEERAQERRNAGAVPRSELAAQARIRAAEREQLRVERALARERKRLAFVGPPMPKSGTAAHFRIRYQTDEAFREKEKARVAAKKASVPLYYARQQLGLGGGAPDVLVEVKRLHLLIKKSLRRVEDEEHQ